MKNLATILLLLALTVLVFAEVDYLKIEENDSPYQTQTNQRNRELNVFFESGFEDGLGDWTTLDATAPNDWNENWHLSTVGAFQGQSWWMGDEAIGGYESHRYLVLDTPEITLPAGSPEMTFNVNWHVEDPGGEPAGYDGWDGCNVRISTDGGTTWNAISGTPAYNCTSLYSFGYEFLEGEGNPGWGSDSDGWVDASFDLSAYAGTPVMIRFAFASDPAFGTPQDTEMFGMKIDNLDIAGVFTSDGEGAAGDAQMVSGYAGGIAGDYWTVDAENPHTGTNAAHCTVNDNLSDELISPAITLPTGENIEIYFDYHVYCDLLDSDGDNDAEGILEDYYIVHIKGIDETTWTRAHYNFNGPETGGVISTWTLIDQDYALQTFAWQSGTCDLSDWAGEDVQIKFEVTTDGNDDGGTGTGLFIDDFRVYNVVYQGPPPENVTATALNDFTVELNWDSSQLGGEEGWLAWDNGALEGFLGLNDPGTWNVASRFTAEDIVPYIGGELTEVKFIPGSSTTSVYTVRVWTGSMAGDLVAEETILGATPEAVNTVTLSTPVPIVQGQEVWIGYQINQIDPAATGGYSAGYDSGPSLGGLYLNTGSGWQDLSGDDAYNKNWNIQGWVSQPDGRIIPFEPVQTNNTRDLDGYKIWRAITSGGEYTEIGTVGSDVTSYVDTTPVMSAFNYYVITSIYDGIDSQYSLEASAYVLGQYSELVVNDDGSAEAGYNVGQGHQMAVKFSPDYAQGEALTTHVQFYVETVNGTNIIFRLYDDNGDDGLPGSLFLAQFPYSGNLVEGWNTFEIPTANQQAFSEGSLYLAILEITNASAIGYDTNNSGNSYSDADGSWALVDGEIMLRIVMEPLTVGTDDNEIPSNVPSISNYPNPFNPRTTISFNMPEAGVASVKIFNVKGQLVRNLYDGNAEVGTMNLTWDGTDTNGENVTSGVYFYTLETKKDFVNKKMILLK